MCFFIPIFICKDCIAYHEKEWHNNDSDSQRNTLDINLNDNSDCMRKKMPTIYKELKNNILEIKNRCGSLCNIEYDDQSKETLSNETFKAVKKTVDCHNLWHSSIFDQPSSMKYPIQKLPSYLLQYFASNGRVKIFYDYRDDTNTENHVTNSWGN